MRRLDSAGEKTHRQLIDCIRSKDTDALIDAINRSITKHGIFYLMALIIVYFNNNWVHEILITISYIV